MNPFGNLTQTTLIYPSIADISQNQYTNVLLIENTVPSYQLFVDSANANTFPIVYSRNCRGNELMELLQSHFTTIDHIGLCFVSRENNPVTFLDNTQLFTSNATGEEALSNSNVRFMIDLINQFSITHVDFLACDTLTYPGWRTYYDILQNNTNAVVGASDNKTGNLKYGGDWILESTTEDIEPIYFNQTIQYYTYLLDNASFITNTVSGAGSDYVGIATDGTNLYIGGYPTASYQSGFISRINIAFPAVNTDSVIWANPATSAGFSSPSGLAINDGNLYVASAGQDTISKISLSNPTTSYTTNWANFAIQGIKSQRQIAIYDNYLYSVSRTTVATEAKIVKISLSGPLTDFSSTWATSAQGVNDPTGMVAYNGYLYVSSGTTGNISKISISNPTNDFIANWATAYKGNCGLYAKDQYLYSSDYTTGKISRIYINNPKDISLNWATSAARACGITNVGDNLYVANATKVAQLSTRPPLLFSTFLSSTTTPAYTSINNTTIKLYNNYMYIGGGGVNGIIQLNLSNNIVDTSWAPTEAQIFNEPMSISLFDGNLYVTDRTTQQQTIPSNPRATYRINISTKTRSLLRNYNPVGAADYGEYAMTSTIVSGNLYIGYSETSGVYGFIRRVMITNPTNYESKWLNSLGGIVSIIGYNNNLYFSNKYGIYTVNVNSSSPTSDCTLFSNSLALPNELFGTAWGLDICNNYLYVSRQSTDSIGRINLSNPSDYTLEYAKENASRATDGGVTGIAIYGNSIYGVSYATATDSGTIFKTSLPVDPVYTIPFVPTITSAQSTSSGKLTIALSDPSNTAVNQTSYLYSTNDIVYKETGVFHNGSPTYNFTISETESGGLFTDISYTLYIKSVNGITQRSNSTSLPVSIYTTPTSLSNCSVSSIGSGNINVSITETLPPTYYYLNNVSYKYYLYTTGTNQSGNGLAYTFGANLDASSYTTNFVIQNQPANNYSVYLIAQNAFGNTASASTFFANVSVYTPPTNTITFDTGNTKTVASGNLQVRLVDPSNIGVNNVYYQYSVNYDTDASFANTFVKANVSPYTFFIPSIVDISNTIYVRASNPVGNTSPSANLQVIVYQTPRPPSQVTFELVQSGNVRVTIQETAPIPDYYYLNNVSYFLYAYNTAGVTNLSGNTAASIYNVPVGILSNTNSSYDNVVSYVNTGLTANTYTMYVIAQNTVGNSNPVFANIVVYTTPLVPSIDSGNTKSTISGALTVSINDSSNSSTNGIYYLYSTDGITYGNSGVPKTSSATNYKFNITNTGDAQIPLIGNVYSLYIKVENPTGNAVSSLSSVNVYTTPLVPSIDSGNTKSTTSGALTVSINDSSNSSTNGIYYLYSTDGITYGNSGVPTTAGNTNYRFTISNTGNAQIPLVANVYTLYIKVENPTGNAVSSPSSVNVYTTPDFPPKIDLTNTKSTTSGNLTVSFTDPSNNPVNAISYWYYIYDPSTGANNSGNVLMYSNSNTTLTTGAQQSFSLSGFVNNTYTVYLLSKNPVGNSVPTNTNVTVYTVPTDVSIDTANTYSVSSGNLQVVLIDPSNGTNNGVYYQYSIDGLNGNAFSNASAQSVGSSSNQYRFYISGFSNATYTINVVAKNTVGTSNATTFTKTVYTLPTSPVIDTGNTLSKTSGNLTVTFNDTSNTSLNDISYGYFLYDSSIELYYG